MRFCKITCTNTCTHTHTRSVSVSLMPFASALCCVRHFKAHRSFKRTCFNKEKCRDSWGGH